MTGPEQAQSSQAQPVVAGSVVLVGCGPGAVDLLTLRALRAIEQADVLIYDNLVGAGILELASPSAEKIYVGKKASSHTLPQSEINALMIALAHEGRKVARLKGGDPFIFGRGGEEREAILAAGLSCEVIPGITAAAGCAAAAGIPLTHRDHAQVLVFVTGHQKQPGLSLDWTALARPNHTLVFYMGVSNAPEIAHQLTEHGLPAETPVALIERGTTPRQRVSRTSLGDLVDHLAREAIHPPALLIVGTVAGAPQD